MDVFNTKLVVHSVALDQNAHGVSFTMPQCLWYDPGTKRPRPGMGDSAISAPRGDRWIS